MASPLVEVLTGPFVATTYIWQERKRKCHRLLDPGKPNMQDLNQWVHVTPGHAHRIVTVTIEQATPPPLLLCVPSPVRFGKEIG